MSASFEFTPENKKRFEEILRRYPTKRAAMLPSLHLTQEQEGYISPEAEQYIADLLEVPVVDVREVVSFYTMFTRNPLGKHHIRVCESLSCWVRGSDEVKETLEKELGVESGGITEDGEYSWEVIPDCLGACELAPMLQLDGYFEGNLTREKVVELLKKQAASKTSGK
ncbi:MAG: NADH-quinone oxidoreductase subunit NuoE [Acidobacteriota bacterium]|nr:MAG: NADH-quinone oxidoreductase subunit NuoE [Acidobacteriota bacterium]